MQLYRRFIKRLLDLVLALVLMPFFLILLFFIGVAIKLDDKGPVFYCGERLGKHGKTFKMIKFRSMKVNAPDWRLEDGSTFNAEDDPRQTRVGKFLRKTSLDEIPQLINIIKDDMSFIGPRPDPIDSLEIYSEEDKILLEVHPGITGYNQAYYRNLSTIREKINNDVYYSKNISFNMDLKIFFSTIPIIFTRKNVYRTSVSPNKEDK
ncbi:sugar transferase [Desnuesiella massiliensis]|uniref:sugar transferase n=1 Tax=Desnuesiella massiliensis TaxID=1650662 RepID=UPI0006E29775|nr:sugar transferase [Desnuesiella massiliensis]